MTTYISTSKRADISSIIKNCFIPQPDSHKGQNGKVLIIGGSTLFHAAPLWSAEVASHFTDMVHFASVPENNELFLTHKKIFRNGIVIDRKSIPSYIEEDDAVLIGPGMVRTEEKLDPSEEYQVRSLQEIDEIENEGIQTYYLTKYLIYTYPHKKWVIDGGALQMMDPEWLLSLKEQPILTPHQKEFARIFNVDVMSLSLDEKIKAVRKAAKQYNSIILLKAIVDIISNGETTYVIEGGNQGLTKGGSGDTLAGLCVSFFTKNNAIDSCVLSSFILKYAADELQKEKGYWFNTEDLIQKIPEIMAKIAL